MDTGERRFINELQFLKLCFSQTAENLEFDSKQVMDFDIELVLLLVPIMFLFNLVNYDLGALFQEFRLQDS